jgi:alpha-glucosidase
LYQVYVRSWLDTNADGYGDLPGVTARLDYLSWLGVAGIWLSPTMPSPDQDWGYDVCDYFGVHPELGTLDDLDALIAEAARRDIKVLLDLAPNHTSSAHPWFVDAVSGPASAHRRFYVWADPAAGGGPPNNWLDATGQPAWARDATSGQYYLHSFLPCMPDLNWWEPAVHDAFAEILRFWFARGVAGFRIDAAHGLYHDASLRDDPPAPGGGRLHSPHGLEQAYSANRPETHGVFRAWRSLADSQSPPRLLLGETWVGDLDRMAAYHGRGDELQLTFNFPFIFADFTAEALASVVAETLAALPAGECPVWTASNHDISRFPSRWCGGDERKARLALLALSMLPGTLILYYGDEIGMTDLDVPAAARRDQMTAGDEGRDHARTPMQWDASPSAGFTATGVGPWLPYGNGTSRNVAAQRESPGSMLRLCRDLIALRAAAFGGRIASYQQLPAPAGVWAYRAGGLVVTANLSGQTATLDCEPGPVLASSAGARALRGRALAPWAGIIARPAKPLQAHHRRDGLGDDGVRGGGAAARRTSCEPPARRPAARHRDARARR